MALSAFVELLQFDAAENYLFEMLVIAQLCGKLALA
jgi:hypothetical protein